MITTTKNDQGYVKSFIEWGIVDKDGVLDKDGKYLFVYDTWVHTEHRHTGLLKEMIARMFESSLEYNYEFVYYRRDKYDGKVSRLYLATKFLKHTRLNEKIKQLAR